MSNYPIGAEHDPSAPYNRKEPINYLTEEEQIEQDIHDSIIAFNDTIEMMKTEALPNDLAHLKVLEESFRVINEQLERYV